MSEDFETPMQESKPDHAHTTDYPSWLVWWFASGVIVTGLSYVGMLVALPFGPYWSKLLASGGLAIGTGSVALSLLRGEDYARRNC